MNNWFLIRNIDEYDSPALVLYKDRIAENILLAIQMTGDINRLRPHVKTNKIAEVCRMMMDAGITKFKCATIAEAEMLGSIGAPDVLLAYQPVGPKANRLITLVKQYPQTHFSCLLDNEFTARTLSDLSIENNIRLSVFIDVNVGMNRTGIAVTEVLPLIENIKDKEGIQIQGLHVYDGHIHDSDFAVRKQKSDAVFEPVKEISKQSSEILHRTPTIVAGGTPTFPVHVLRGDVECSPGTFVFWDWGYKHMLPDEPFAYAAVLITRVISVIDKNRICTDLGHKSVAAENPLPRVHFLNAPSAVPVSQSEEHLVLQVQNHSYAVGDVLYGVPVHICPTVALYDTAQVVTNGNITNNWKVVARDRMIHV